MKMTLFALVAVFFVVSNTAASGAEPLPALFEVVKVVPTNERHLMRTYSINQDGDGIGEELPASVSYYHKVPNAFSQEMAVTDLSLCRRPAEAKICRSFMAAIASKAPTLGTDITATRISGSDFATVFLKRLDNVAFAGVDAATVFLGVDSQDHPLGDLVLYVYAKKGTNLIQLSAPVAACKTLPTPGESDEAYYRKHCLSAATLKKARVQGDLLRTLFRLKP